MFRVPPIIAATRPRLIIGGGGGGGSPPTLDGHKEKFISGGTTIVSDALVTANANDIIIALIGVYEGVGQSIVSVVGSTLGAFTLRLSENRSGRRYTAAYYCKAPSALTGEVITVTFGVADSFAMLSVFGVSGANYASPFDAGGPQGVAFGAGSYATMTTASPNTFIYGASLAETGTGTPVAGTGWTTLYGFGGQYVVSGYQTSAGTGTFVFTSSATIGQEDGAVIDAIKA